MALLFRVEIRDNQSGAPISISTVNGDSGNIFNENWPLDSDTRCVMPGPHGYPIEVRIKRIL